MSQRPPGHVPTSLRYYYYFVRSKLNGKAESSLQIQMSGNAEVHRQGFSTNINNCYLPN